MFLILSLVAGAVAGVVGQDRYDLYGYALRAVQFVRRHLRK